MTFLATTASIAPFIGLFGTVWGIMMAFAGIGAAGSTNLAVVGAGHRRGADCHGGRPVRGHPGGLLLQPLHVEGEGARVRDGRLLARVPEHRRAELHLEPMPKVMAAAPRQRRPRSRGRRVSTSLAEINVIPLVDVMLVLLIIFMVAAPMLQRGIEVNLPVARASPRSSTSSGLRDRAASLPQGPARAISARKAIRLDGAGRADAAGDADARPTSEVFLRGDGGVQLQELIEVIGPAEGGRRRARRHPHAAGADEAALSRWTRSADITRRRAHDGRRGTPADGAACRCVGARRRWSRRCCSCRRRWMGTQRAGPRPVMTISLGGAPGPQTGGRRPRAAGRCRRSRRRPRDPSRAPPAAKTPEMVEPTKAPPRKKPPPKVHAGADATQTARTTPSTGAAGAAGRGAWPTPAREPGPSAAVDRRPAAPAARLDVGNFCCPEYLVDDAGPHPAQLGEPAAVARHRP